MNGSSGRAVARRRAPAARAQGGGGFPAHGRGRRRAGAVRQHVPCAVGRAHHVGGIELQQFGGPIGADTPARAQEARVGIDQGGGQRAVGQQALRAVESPSTASSKRARCARPASSAANSACNNGNGIGSKRQGSGGEPGSRLATPSSSISGPVAARVRPARRAEAGENAKQTAPLRAQSAFAIHHFVECHAQRLTSQPVRRKSPANRSSTPVGPMASRASGHLRVGSRQHRDPDPSRPGRRRRLIQEIEHGRPRRLGGFRIVAGRP